MLLMKMFTTLNNHKILSRYRSQLNHLDEFYKTCSIIQLQLECTD